MPKERETAYGPVALFVAFLVIVLIGSVAVRRPNPKVQRSLTLPPKAFDR